MTGEERLVGEAGVSGLAFVVVGCDGEQSVGVGDVNGVLLLL